MSKSARNTNYDPEAIEPKWQGVWEKEGTFCAVDGDKREKYYALDMFPYPSGDGLHIGHPEGYTATDILSRYKRARGYNVLHPMGWDAFGLPAEQHAIATGMPPEEKTAMNIETFKRQLKRLGFAYDWEREVNTTDVGYYKWTQWIFLQLFRMGLAYVDEKPVWWCPALGTVLANEEVIDGKSERGNHPVERRNLRQWVLRITAYAERLLKGLEGLDWPDSTKRQQIAWIGKSEGANVDFKLEKGDGAITCFTTRIDTLFGVGFVVIAPEHPLVGKLVTEEQAKEVERYVKEAAGKSDLARTDLATKRSGVATGGYVINPINGKRTPVWVADYVLMSYGTGAVMGVPGHDERDNELAKVYGLERPCVIVKKKEDGEEKDYFGEGYLVNSGEYTGMESGEAKVAITKQLEKEGKGKFVTNYKLRDWLFSRQRYWGEPFPIVWVEEGDYERLLKEGGEKLRGALPKEPVRYCGENGVWMYAVPVVELPVKLPKLESYQPSGSVEGPLGKAKEWLEVNLNIGDGRVVNRGEVEGKEWVKGVRETNTMPQWAGSCWYYLRYMDPRNEGVFVGKEKEEYWKGPDIYIGGAEHAVLHLLYARFWHQVLYDLGYVATPEPFPRVVHQGLILGEPEHMAFKTKGGVYVSAEHVENGVDTRTGEAVTGEKLRDEDVVKEGEGFVLVRDRGIRVDTRAYKMSKSRGNVVNPDAVVKQYGADALRMYEMFLGPLEASKPWSTGGIEGISRFLKRMWREYVGEDGELNGKVREGHEDSVETLKLLEETVKKVGEDIEGLKFNTAISQMMIFLNHMQKLEMVSRRTARAFVQVLAPFAPHIGEELWEVLGEKGRVIECTWPEVEGLVGEVNEEKVMVQVNGKLRGEMRVKKGLTQEAVVGIAREDEKVGGALAGKEIVKVIYVPGKILNFVVKG